jgi:two-component system phosphate regulon sensor histidine kinase PhoR
MVEGVVALDANERLLFVNERAVSLLELPAKNPVGRRFWELVRVPELLDAVSRAVKGTSAVIREMEWPGTPSHSLTIHATPLSADSQTQIQGAVVVVHDTTELKRLDRLRRDFVANVSHELKTPLSVIKLCAETLDAGAMDDPAARGGFLSQIIRQSERLSFLIVDLLTIARIEGGREMLRPQALEVAEALADCAARHREQAEQRGVRLLVTPPPGDLWIWMDEEALTQILDNLVANAIRYNQEGGSVTLSAKAVTDSTAPEKAGHIGSVGLVGQVGYVEIEVTDTGVGIPEADLPRIFERFFRVEKARSRDLGGTGLGLSIVKHLVTASQGSIVAKSSLGRGSVFTLRLPRVQAD